MYSENVKVVKLVVSSGADVNSRGERYGNTLQAAAVSQNQDVIQFLLSKGADANGGDGLYGSALQAAVFAEWYDGSYMVGPPVDTARLLVDHGANVNSRGEKYGSPLYVSMAGGDSSNTIEIIDTLLEHGADVNACGAMCVSAFSVLLAVGNEKGVDCLITAGDDISLLCEQYYSILQALAASGATSYTIN